MIFFPVNTDATPRFLVGISGLDIDIDKLVGLGLPCASRRASILCSAIVECTVPANQLSSAKHQSGVNGDP